MVLLELEARLNNLISTAQEETADIDLFAPMPEREECPICLIPLPSDYEVVYQSCCGKQICLGCYYKHMVTDIKKGVQRKDDKCAFCRQPTPTRLSRKSLKKLMKKNDPQAFIQMAIYYKEGDDGMMQSDTKSLEMLIRAAEFGHGEAYLRIGEYYDDGLVVEQDISKMVAFYEVSAKKGYVQAHRYLALFHAKNWNNKKSFEHMKMAASAGDKDAVDLLVKSYKIENSPLSKEELTQTLRAFQAANDNMKSEDRENARLIEEYRERGEVPPVHLLK